MEMQDLSGPVLGHPLHLTPVSTFDKTMLINTRGTFLGCKYAIAQMMKQGVRVDGSRGWIINMASIAGLIGSRGAGESFMTHSSVSIFLTK
jgi:NAD(P)-dependent dehydrogenase (short-subunit alcohol dehydrogenase family)